MYRVRDQRASFRLTTGTAALVALVGILSGSALAIAQTQPSGKKAVSDAQVEANVLKALAGASDLTDQAITTTTVYGVVTLSGSGQTEGQRTEAETIVSKTPGVQKVVDEMTLGGETANAQPPQESEGGSASSQGPDNGEAANPALQTEGTMAQQPPSPVAQGAPNGDGQASPNQASGPYYGPGAPEYRQPYQGQQAPPPPPGYSQDPRYSQSPSQDYGYPQQQGYPQRQGYPQQEPSYPQQGYSRSGQPVYGGQEAGQMVTVQSGALVRIRVNQPLDSGHSKPGQRFDGVVVNDVVADGAVAIPRGASVEGVVVDAKSSGTLAGRGELSLQLTQVTLGGRTYPIVSDLWAHNGGDKTVHTVNNTAIGTGVGALFGAAAGGGEGAAIGAGVGAALGLGASAASGRGQVYVPSEGMLTFHIAQPTTVATVSQMEMDRLAQGVGPARNPERLQRRYPTVYYGPVYGPYYRPYGYPYYPYPY
jgi:hypothetical protein